jgi:hypothetical protein
LTGKFWNIVGAAIAWRGMRKAPMPTRQHVEITLTPAVVKTRVRLAVTLEPNSLLPEFLPK